MVESDYQTIVNNDVLLIAVIVNSPQTQSEKTATEQNTDEEKSDEDNHGNRTRILIRLGEIIESFFNWPIRKATTMALGEAAGFSLHAGVAAKANERAKLERLCRYITRPAVSTKRLSMTRNGRVRYECENTLAQRYDPCAVRTTGFYLQVGFLGA